MVLHVPIKFNTSPNPFPTGSPPSKHILLHASFGQTPFTVKLSPKQSIFSFFDGFTAFSTINLVYAISIRLLSLSKSSTDSSYSPTSFSFGVYV